MDQHTVINASIGLSASFLAVITSFQQEIEWWVRISSSVVGLLIAIMSLILMVRKFLEGGHKEPTAEDE